MTNKPISEREFKLLLDAGAVRSASIEPAPGAGWSVVVRVGMEERPVSSVRHDVRTWKKLDTLTRWLQEAGVSEAFIKIN